MYDNFKEELIFFSWFQTLKLLLVLFCVCPRSPEGLLPFSKFLRVLTPFENLVHLSRAKVQHVVCT